MTLVGWTKFALDRNLAEASQEGYGSDGAIVSLMVKIIRKVLK